MDFFSTRKFIRTISAFSVLLPGLVGEAHSQDLNTLTQAEKDAGWVSLFDGKSLFGWHKQLETVTASSWVVNDNAIFRSTGGNLYSPVITESFEFTADWKLQAENGNSGIWMRMLESLPESNRSGPEMQILGKTHPDYTRDKRTAGSCYMMYHPNPPPDNWIKPAGQWNTYRIIMDGKHVEHWANGLKVVEYEIGSADWLSRQAQAENRIKNPRYGEVHYGSFVLTDHQTPVWYRNIKVRPLGGTQIRSAFPGFVVHTREGIIKPHRRIPRPGREDLDAEFARTGRDIALLSLVGRTLSYRPRGTAAGGYLTGDSASKGQSGPIYPALKSCPEGCGLLWIARKIRRLGGVLNNRPKFRRIRGKIKRKVD